MATGTMLPQMPSINAEEKAFQEEVQAIKQWWSDSRWRYTKRTFTAEQIATKRGNLKIQYPSNEQSKKLWRTVEGRFQVRRFHMLVTAPCGATTPPYTDTRAHCRTKMLASPMAAWTRSWSRRWPSTSTPSTSLVGNAHRLPRRRTSPAPILPTIPWYVPYD